MKTKKSEERTVLVMGDVKKKYRIIIQERKSKSDKLEKCRSFMLYDYTGKSNIDTLKDKLSKRAVRFYR